MSLKLVQRLIGGEIAWNPKTKRRGLCLDKAERFWAYRAPSGKYQVESLLRESAVLTLGQLLNEFGHKLILLVISKENHNFTVYLNGIHYVGQFRVNTNSNVVISQKAINVMVERWGLYDSGRGFRVILGEVIKP